MPCGNCHPARRLSGGSNRCEGASLRAGIDRFSDSILPIFLLNSYFFLPKRVWVSDPSSSIGDENLLTPRRVVAMFTLNLIESGRGTGPMKPRQPPRPAMR